jgi:hypothetical protein
MPIDSSHRARVLSGMIIVIVILICKREVHVTGLIKRGAAIFDKGR